MSETKDTIETTSTSTMVIKRQFAPEDGTIPYRFVGSHEYLSALQAFDPLVALSPPEEILVYDKLINEQKEFTFYSGVVSRLGPNTNLFSASPAERFEFDSSFKKSSLAWLMALARVELGATMSMYGNSKVPFSDIANPNFGLEEFQQVLLDDLAAHLESIKNDEKLKKASNMGAKVDSTVLAYIRRMKLVNDMLAVVEQSPEPAVSEKAIAYRREIIKKGKRLAKKVKLAETDTVVMMTSGSTETQSGFRGETSVVSQRPVSNTPNNRCLETFSNRD